MKAGLSAVALGSSGRGGGQSRRPAVARCINGLNIYNITIMGVLGGLAVSLVGSGGQSYG